MTIQLLYPMERLVLPGRKKDSEALVNPRLKDEVRINYDVCDGDGEIITVAAGRHVGRDYIPHEEEKAFLKNLEDLIGDLYKISTWPIGNGRVRFEAYRSFPCRLVVS